MSVFHRIGSHAAIAPGQDQKGDRYALVRGAELSVGLGSLVKVTGSTCRPIWHNQRSEFGIIKGAVQFWEGCAKLLSTKQRDGFLGGKHNSVQRNVLLI